MPRTIQELFTYSATDMSAIARDARASFTCPIQGGPCSKNNDDGAERGDPILGGPLGVCSVFNPQAVGPSRITCLCPTRLYGHGFETLRGLARDVLGAPTQPTYLFSEWVANGMPDGVVLMGKGESGEFRTEAGSFDWIAGTTQAGKLVSYAGIEAQAIDTTGNYRANRAALMRGEKVVPPSGHGLNWENVNKRIIPQLLRKGMLLKKLAETEPAVGLGFLVDANVFAKFDARLSNPMADDQGFDLVIHAYSLSATKEYEPPSLVKLKSIHASVEQLAEKFLAVPGKPTSIADQIARVFRSASRR